jgi:hypothetical protein
MRMSNIRAFPFPKRKIVSLSIVDFCDQEEIDRFNYFTRGVHAEGIVPNRLLSEFIQEIPEGTEFVVHYQTEYYYVGDNEYANAYGLALIPKE